MWFFLRDMNNILTWLSVFSFELPPVLFCESWNNKTKRVREQQVKFKFETIYILISLFINQSMRAHLSQVSLRPQSVFSTQTFPTKCKYSCPGPQMIDPCLTYSLQQGRIRNRRHTSTEKCHDPFIGHNQIIHHILDCED